MRKYWLCIAIAGVLTVISGCGAGSSSKSSANEGYIMETAAGAMEYGNAGVSAVSYTHLSVMKLMIQHDFNLVNEKEILRIMKTGDSNIQR